MAISISEVNSYASARDKYTFRSVLGEGSFGTVFRATDNTANEEVAIKIVKVKKSVLEFIFRRKAQSLNDAKEEATMLVRLEHENIVALKDFYEFEKLQVAGIAMVMEFCPNGNLQVFLEKSAQNQKRLDPPLRIKWYKQLSTALQFIHSKGIVHRDLKPPNILLDSDNNIKVADVGLAKTAWDIKSQCNELPQDSTFYHYLSTRTGTPAYMAPEVWNEHYQMSSDIFSLGLIFAMIAEVPNPPIPYARYESNNDCLGLLMYKYPRSHTDPPTDLFVHHLELEHISSDEIKLFNDMLQYKYHNRPTALGVIKQIQKIEDSLKRKDKPDEPEPPPPPPDEEQSDGWLQYIYCVIQ